MTDLITPALEWLASRGPPNWVLLVALVTNVGFWSKKVRKRCAPVLDKFLPIDGDG